MYKTTACRAAVHMEMIFYFKTLFFKISVRVCAVNRASTLNYYILWCLLQRKLTYLVKPKIHKLAEALTFSLLLFCVAALFFIRE